MKKEINIIEMKKFWDGNRVGFNEELYRKYLKEKNKWRIKMN